MEVSKIINKHLAVAIVLALALFGVGWRLTPHIPNFAPIGAIALIAGQILGWRKSLAVTLAIMVISDAMIGFYQGMWWTWLGFGLIASFGFFIKSLPLAWRISVGAVGASGLFFIVSNFGTWLSSGMYSLDLAGLVECYTMALPFLRATILSDFVFIAVFVGLFEAVVTFHRTRLPFTLKNLVY